MTNSNGIIISNQAQCLLCGDAPVSKHWHDYVPCLCEAMAVDGGQEFIRRVGKLPDIRDLSIIVPVETVDAVISAIENAKKTNRNHFDIACAILRVLRDHGELANALPPLDDVTKAKHSTSPPTPVDPGRRELGVED